MTTDDRSGGDASDGAASLAGRRVVVGVSGGIAAYKAILLTRLLVVAGADVHAVLTRGAGHFVGAATFEGITGNPVRSEVWDDVDRAVHISLAREADAVVVLPATAHLLAKVAGGLADDLLTNLILAATCPVILCPAMHTEMWSNPATQANAELLRTRGYVLLGPADGELMGGDSGPGRVVEPETVLPHLIAALHGTGDLAGFSVVVTAGGTREAIDPVRYLGNRSSGKMGFAIAAVAAQRGAKVTLVSAPSHLPTPPGVERVDVVSALEMHKAVLDLADGCDVIVKAAAVADFRPANVAGSKLKKAAGTPELALVPNPDILADLGARRPLGQRPFLVGFAAETDDPEAHGRAKLERKNADLLVVNDVSRSDAGFEVDTNRVLILGRDGRRVDVPLASKYTVAGRLWDEAVTLLR